MALASIMETTTKHIALDKIDDPQIAIRTQVDDGTIDALMASMTANGLIEPIVVRPRGSRFEIIAGHRRTRAARLLRWELIEAKVIKCTDDQAFSMRLAENLERLDVDPVDEAAYVGEIILRTHKSPEDIAGILHRSADWVHTRLAVFELPDYAKQYLATRQLGIGATLELAEIKTERVREYYTHYAAANGVTVATARRWKNAANEAAQRSASAPAPDPAELRSAPVAVVMQECAECGQSSPIEQMTSVYVHGTCPEGATEEVASSPTPPLSPNK